MKYIAAAFAMASIALISSCDMPEPPAIRIGISQSPGSSVLYLAETTGLFKTYKVDVKLVELTCSHELRAAFASNKLDAVTLPHDQFELAAKESGLEAGVLLLVAAPGDLAVSEHFEHCDSTCRDMEVEVLVGRRGDIMLRRKDWQKVLLAYEHARLLMASGHNKYLSLLAEREHKDISRVSEELSHWQVFGSMQQDSLLGKKGPFAGLQARWQGQVHFSSLVASEAQRLLGERPHAVTGDK